LRDLFGYRNVGVQFDRRGLQTLRFPEFFCGNFLKKVAHKLPKRPQDSKQTVADTDQQTLQKLQETKYRG
jgi:hypothetical protein